MKPSSFLKENQAKEAVDINITHKSIKPHLGSEVVYLEGSKCKHYAKPKAK